MVWRALVALAIVLATARGARAHQSAVKDVRLVVDGAALDVTLRASRGDVAEAVGAAVDDVPTMAAIQAAATAVGRELQGWVQVATPDGPCTAAPVALSTGERDDVLVARWRATCAAPVAVVHLDFAGFFARARTHSAILHLTAPGAAPFDAVVEAGTPVLTVPLHGARPGTALGWIRAGLAHIYGGADHVAFVLALLLVVVLGRGPTRGAVVRRGAVDALRHTGAMVTGFTVAHSLTLIAASLGVVRAPAMIVEAVIAASIAFTAIENVVAPTPRYRLALTFGFGLVHGLGFASALAEILPTSGVVRPLLLFNVGVELGQLSIVAVTLPLLWALARALGAERYRRIALPVLCAPLALVGLGWLVERLAGVAFMPF